MGSDVGALLDLGWKLLLVLGLAVLAMRALRWLSSPGLNPGGPLKVIARLPIGPQQTVIVVSVGQKKLLLGQSPNQITVLTELAAEDWEAAAMELPVIAPARTLVVGGRVIRVGHLPRFVEQGLAALSKLRGQTAPQFESRSSNGHAAASSVGSAPAPRGDGE